MEERLADDRPFHYSKVVGSEDCAFINFQISLRNVGIVETKDSCFYLDSIRMASFVRPYNNQVKIEYRGSRFIRDYNGG